MAAPTVRAVGTIASSTTTASPGLPSGTVAGDLLVMFTETDGAETASVSGWTELATDSPQTADTGSATDTKLAVFWKIAAGGDATTTNDPGNHIIGRIIGITAGTFDSTTPINVSAGGTETTADTSGSIPGATTDRDDCLVLAAISTGYDAASNGTAQFSAWTNSNLTSLTERIDNQRITGTGGCLGVASGVMATAGDYGSTAVTLANSALKAMISLAIQPPVPLDIPTVVIPQGIGASW